MVYNLRVDRSKKFRTLMEVVSFMPPYSNLRPREKDVLAVLYEMNSTYSHLPLEQREQLIFHKSSRKKAAEQCGISMDAFYNLIKDLVKKGLLVNDGFVQKFVINDADEVVFKIQPKV